MIEPDHFTFEGEEEDTLKSHDWRSSVNPDEIDKPFEQHVYKHRHAYVYKLNNSNTAIRGCITCGQMHGTLVMGEPQDLVWHLVQEPEEPEE